MGDDASSKTAATRSNIWNSMVAGGLSGVGSRFLVYPIDTLKTRLQVRERPSMKSPSQFSTTRPRIFSLYSGFSVVLMSVVPGNALYFGGYEFGGTMLPKSWGIGQGFASGVCAQLLGGLVFTPMDVIKERCQAGGDGKSTPSLKVRSLIRELGWRGLMRGYWVSNAMWVPWSAIYAGMYGISKDRFGKWRGDLDGFDGEHQGAIPTWGFAVCSAWSAIVASTLTHPIDVVKTQLQVLSGRRGFQRDAGAMNFLKSLWVNEGWRGLTRGYGARIASIAPQSALAWMLYETAKSRLEKSDAQAAPL
ncbi:hypothetical protein BSKO_03707 [Bryopsis sp. KO-2023]|nr:hypothetical protein BSKO_03707 [Bryopsis sp. KO-2023]